jgi:aconitate hydratase 2/2-methylisocitrate dehydratase
MKSNLALIKMMVATGYESAETLNRRAAAIEEWLLEPSLLRADSDANYAADISVSLDDINEPILACPNNPDDVRPLSAVAGEAIDEVFIGSCMTRYEHFVSAAKILSSVPIGKTLPCRLWIAPPTRMIRDKLIADGHYSVFDRVGAKLETPGCSLCMGNQKRTADNATVLSASTRNFPNRMGKGTRVYLGGAKLCALTAMTGRLPGASEYFAAMD